MKVESKLLLFFVVVIHYDKVSLEIDMQFEFQLNPQIRRSKNNLVTKFLLLA